MSRMRGGPAKVLEPEDLLRLAMARPSEAEAEARALLASNHNPMDLSFARQAIGIVLRDRGEPVSAIRELRTALRLARVTGNRERASDVRATLGVALVMSGRTRAGLEQLDTAAQDVHGVTLAKIRLRRAYVLELLGRHGAALGDLRLALNGIRRAGDAIWEARALNNRSLIHIALGAIGPAERDLVRAQRLFAQTGQDVEAVRTLHNRGVVADLKGDLPLALALYDEANERFAVLGVSSPELANDRCLALLAAGLPQEAVHVVTSVLTSGSLSATNTADLKLRLASAALADAEIERALASAREAREFFRTHDDELGWARAELVVVQARYRSGTTTRSLLRATAALGNRLEAMRAEEAPLAHLLAGRIAAHRQDDSRAQHFRAAARYRRKGSGLARATGWLAQALECDASGSSRGVFAACTRGLAVLDEHRQTLGSSELRALATRHGEELASLALHQASIRHRPRSLLHWAERWRATALSQPPVRPVREKDLVADLAARRDCGRRLDEARISGRSTANLEQERSRLEVAIRSTRLKVAGEREELARLDVGRLVAEVDRGSLIEIVEIDKALHVLLVDGGRVRHFCAGDADDAFNAVEFARLALRQVGRGRAADLSRVGSRLQAALLGPASAAIPDGPVVIAPPGRFHATPWALVPTLAERAIASIPSAALWLRVKALKCPRHESTALIVGPGLSTGGAEVAALIRKQRATHVLRDGAATVQRSLAAMDGASLAHIAAHGQFRRDSPMFSCLILDDGPLTVHDFELLGRAPYRMILSACDSGVMAPVGADELLGFVSCMFSLGAAGLVTSVTEVNDAATVDFMIALHDGIDAGRSLAEVLLDARLSAGSDPVAQATAAAFVAFGV